MGGVRWAGLAFGIAFGFILGWARLTDYDVIHNMLLLREADVFLIMGSGIAVAAIGSRLLRALHLRDLAGGAPVSWSVALLSRDTLIGSMIFGTGWAIACTCPGPVAAQLGRGQWSAVFTASGIMLGVALRAWMLERRKIPHLGSAAPLPAEAQGPCAGL
jgi:uncharacterized membrane protein YedE/YeeE